MNINNQTPFQVEGLPYTGPDRKCFLTVIVKGTFNMHNGGPSSPAQEQLPMVFGDEPFDPENGGSIKFEADIAPFKPRADVVLIGHAYAPVRVMSVQGIDVSLRVGKLHRVLRVLGDRRWRCHPLLPDAYSSPEPFKKMPLVYEKAFGGIDKAGGGHCPRNLVGCGYFSKPNNKCVNSALLPNIEDPQNLIRSPKDKPFPAGFGFFGRAWQPRCDFMGTYDETWRKTRAPDLPDDFSYEYHCGAHPDLQLQGYLEGNEKVELLNLTPESEMRFELPGISPVCRIEKHYEALAAFLENQDAQHPDLEKIKAAKHESEDVSLKLDTFCLLPDEARYFLIWRGRTEIHDMTALEVKNIEVA